MTPNQNDDHSERGESYKLRYDGLAEQYDLIFGILLRHGQCIAMDVMKIQSGMRVLEVGVGTGLTLPMFPEGTLITGIDVAVEMLRKARERISELGLKGIELHKMSAEKLDFENNTFDRVFAPSVLSVVRDPQAVLDEMIRVCKPGGLICVIAHFAGDTFSTKFVDRVFDRFTRKFFDYRMTTPRSIVERNSKTRVLSKHEALVLNFNNVYLLQKI